ncbi:RidA family protein [Streptomyces sp. NPDC005840]|uniref:RidA family protein n=1 Tax=Streptomyces sp. NPDC005840 TaxID=3157072 RepID=UPI0033E313A0
MVLRCGVCLSLAEGRARCCADSWCSSAQTGDARDHLREPSIRLLAVRRARCQEIPCRSRKFWLPLRDGALVATGQLAARWCAVNVLAQAEAALGGLGQIRQLVKITVLVTGVPGLAEHHLAANGTSDLFVEVLGEAGRHARSAIGVAAPPMRAPVEIEAVIATV